MDYKINISTIAKNQLVDIVNYIAYELQAPQAALKISKLLQQEINSLAFMPSRMALVSQEPWHSKGVRKLIVKQILVYFFIDDNKREVNIIGIINSRMDQLKHLHKLM